MGLISCEWLSFTKDHCPIQCGYPTGIYLHSTSYTISSGRLPSTVLHGCPECWQKCTSRGMSLNIAHVAHLRPLFMPSDLWEALEQAHIRSCCCCLWYEGRRVAGTRGERWVRWVI